MSARRQARVRVYETDADAVPVCLLMGPCIEVWAKTDAETPPFSALRRHRSARNAWLDARGVDRTAERCSLIPLSSPWSVQFILENRPTGLRERLDRVERTVEDVPDLRDDALLLIKGLAHA